MEDDNRGRPKCGRGVATFSACRRVVAVLMSDSVRSQNLKHILSACRVFFSHIADLC